MNALHDALLGQYESELSHAASAMLSAVRKWSRAFSRATGCELRAAKAVAAWQTVLWEARALCGVLDEWREIGVQPEELEGRLAPGEALLAYLAAEVEGMRARNAPGADYEHVCRRLRSLAAGRREGRR